MCMYMCVSLQIVEDKKRERKLSYDRRDRVECPTKKPRGMNKKKKKPMTDRSLHLNDCPLSNAEIEHVLKVYDLKYHPSLQDRLKVARNTKYRFALLTHQYHLLIINRTHTTIFYNVDRYIIGSFTEFLF